MRAQVATDAASSQFQEALQEWSKRFLGIEHPGVVAALEDGIGAGFGANAIAVAFRIGRSICDPAPKSVLHRPQIAEPGLAEGMLAQGRFFRGQTEQFGRFTRSEKYLRIPVQVADAAFGSLLVFDSRGKRPEWQVERRREDLVGGGLDAEVVANDGVGDFVVFPAADAVNEEIAQADTREERERQGAGAERLNVAGGGRSPALAVVGVDPEWRFTLRQFGSGVVVAANAIGFSVCADGGVVDGAEARQIVEYLPGEMSKCPGPRQSTDGEIEIAATPPALALASDRGEDFPHVLAQAPHLRQERLETPVHPQWGGAVGEGAEEFHIKNGAILIGAFAVEPIEGKQFDVGILAAKHRELERWVLERVVIDDQVERRAAQVPGQAIEREVLDPDAGMCQLGLMAGQNQWRQSRSAVEPARTSRRASVRSSRSVWPSTLISRRSSFRRLAATRAGMAPKPGSARTSPLRVGARRRAITGAPDTHRR